MRDLEAARVRVVVEPMPAWLDRGRWLGPGEVAWEPLDDGWGRAILSLSARDAAELAARLRGLGVGGRAVEVRTEPPLRRHLVREARLADARARRDTTPGFTRREARATGEGRFSLTPEMLALAMGELASGRSVVDACCGSGGNAIGFARAGSAVTALELDAARLDEARHNARVYGARIDFREADARALVPSLSADILFVDPPWGESYDKRRTTLADLPLLGALLAAPLPGYRELWLKLPPSFAIDELPAGEPRAWFGEAPGDFRRIKFLLVRIVRS